MCNGKWFEKFGRPNIFIFAIRRLIDEINYGTIWKNNKTKMLKQIRSSRYFLEHSNISGIQYCERWEWGVEDQMKNQRVTYTFKSKDTKIRIYKMSLYDFMEPKPGYSIRRQNTFGRKLLRLKLDPINDNGVWRIMYNPEFY